MCWFFPFVVLSASIPFLLMYERKRAREKLAAVEAEWEEKLNKVIWADHVIYGDEEVDAMKAEIASLKRSLEHAYWPGQQALGQAGLNALAAQQNMAASGLLQQAMMGQYPPTLQRRLN